MKKSTKAPQSDYPEMIEHQDLKTEKFTVTFVFPNDRLEVGNPLKLMANRALVESLPNNFAARLSFLAGVEHAINQRKRRDQLK